MIQISPGHWHQLNSGASSIINEVTEARRVVARVSQLLTLMKVSHNVIQDNTSKNKQENLNWLVAQHNRTKSTLDVSIHFNAATKTCDDRGTEVYYYDQKSIANKVSLAISNVSGLKNRGSKQQKAFQFLNSTKSPAILIEVCFVDSEADVKKYQANFEAICIAIAESISNRKYTKPEPPKPTEQDTRRKGIKTYWYPSNSKGFDELESLLKAKGWNYEVFYEEKK